MRSLAQDSGLRSVYGSVSFNGALNNPGSADFIVIKTGTGTYQIRFLKSFRQVPVVTIGGSGAVFVSVAGTNEYITVSTFNQAGAAADQSFSFIASGR